MKIFKFVLPMMLVTALCTACGSDQSSSPSYKEMKSMVVDILKTEEAQKAIEEAGKQNAESSDQSSMIRMLESPQGEQMQMAVKQVLTDPSYSLVLKDMMIDPKFAGEFAKAVQKENEEIHKALMKDPEYQSLLLDAMKSPEFEKMFLDLMKSKPYRQQMMTVITETMDNPIFKLKYLELMEKALEEQANPKKKEEGSEGGSDSGSSNS